MYVVIVGGGEVGRTVADTLSTDHEVAVIDPDPTVIEDLDRQYDLLTIEGDGTEQAILEAAGLESADIVIAATGDDEANIVICGTVKARTDAFTIARVKRRDYLETWRSSDNAYGVDFMVCTDLLAAQAVARLAGVPGAMDLDTFVGGIVRMAKFAITEESTIAGQTVAEADQYDGLTFAALFRDEEEVVIPTGDTILRPNDRVVVIGDGESLWAFASDLTHDDEHDTEEVVIIGGSEVGFQTARLFAERGLRTRLIERDETRARTIAEMLPEVTVLQRDATDVEFLEREHVQQANMVVSALDGDEKNLFVSLLASRIGAERTVTFVDRIEYSSLFETVGVDAAVSPREETAEEIIRFTRKDKAKKIAMLEADSEVIEIEIDEESVLANRTIAEAADEVPEQFVIGAIARRGSVITPRGETTVYPGDHLVVFVRTARINDLLERL